MEPLFPMLLTMLSTMWWPFCRFMAMLTAAPIIGEMAVPVTVRILLSLVMAVIMAPIAKPVEPIEMISLHAVVITFEQAVIGGVIGLAFHLAMSSILILGSLVSSQMGLSMAIMNDPINGTSSDVVSSLLSLLGVLAFFSIDGHLVLTGIVGASFKAWPVGVGIGALSMQTLAYNVAWVFSAAILLAMPVIFATLVVQIGFGFLTRVAPALNLFSLGFSVVTLFGLLMLTKVAGFVPDHYLRMLEQVLQMLQQMMKASAHG